MAWLILLLASLFEMTWVVGLKFTGGFTRLWPSLFTVAASVVSMVLLAQATRTLPIATSYVIWTGLGAAGSVTLGIFWIGDEVASLPRLLCIGLIVIGVMGLKLNTPDPHVTLPPGGDQATNRAADQGALRVPPDSTDGSSPPVSSNSG